MGKAVATAGAVIAGAALIATGIGAVGLLATGAFSVGTAWTAAGATLSVFGMSAATLQTVGGLLVTVGGLTTKRPEIQTGGNPTQQTYDPQAGIPYPMGRTAVGGRIIYGTTTGPTKEPNKYRLHYSILAGAGPIDGIESYSANNVNLTFSADSGEGAAGAYLNRLWQVRRLGAASDTYLRFTATGTKDTPADHSGNPPEWTSAHLLGGYAAALTGMEYDTKVYAADVSPLWVLRGVKVYDPRLDDTYPGGDGDCRALDESTYVYSTNPWLHALTLALGRYQNGHRIMGFGFPISSLIVSQFVDAANVAEANGWEIGGTIYSTDEKWSVLQAIAQCGGGYCVPMGAQVGCVINAPRVSLATITSADIRGEASAAGTKGRRERINRVIPRFRSEAHGWEIVSAAPIEVATHVTEDGGLWRTREIDYPLVQAVNHAAQLARYDVENSRELEPISVRVGLPFLGYRPGDCVTIDVPEIGLEEREVIILRRSFDPASATVTFQCRTETDAKHAFALGQTSTAPPTPGLTAGGTTPVAPDTDDWVATGATLTDNGVSIPAIVIVGEMSNPHVTALLVRYRPAGATNWTMGPTVELTFDEEVRVELTGLTPETTYELSIAYRSVRGVVSDWTALDDVVAGSFAFDTIGTTDGLLTVYYQTSAPASPERGDVWFDTDAGNAPFQWDGAAWIDASDNAAVQAIQFATAAQATADTKIKTFYQASAPSSDYADGDLWVDTDDGNRRVYRRGAGTWNVIADQTGFNVAAAISGQGALATLNQAAWATQVTGTGKPEDYATKSLVTRSLGAPSSPGVNDIWVALDGGGTPVAVYAWTGSAWVKGADTTLFFTAAAISGQGALATLNQAAWATQVTGTGKPEDYATKSLVTRSIGSPSSPGVNDIWVALDGGGTPVAVYAWTGSAWVKGADTTLFNTAAAISGQGALATLNQADWATRVTGVGKPDDYANKVLHYKQNATPSSPGVNDIWTQLDGVGNPIAIWAWNGSAWINGADRTVYNTAAAITGQGTWATASVPSGLTPVVVGQRTQYFATDGRLYDYRGVLYGYSVDGVAGRATQPLSAGAGTVSVASHNVYFPTASGTTSISVPSTTHTGLLYDTDYTIYYRPQYGDHHAVQSIYAWAFNASIDGYMWIGNVRTASSGGSWTAPPTDAADFVGVYSDIICVWSDAFLASGQRAGDAVAGDPLTLMAPGGDSIMPGRVLANIQGFAQCLTFETACGAVKTVSLDTPIMTRAAPGYIPTATWAKACLPGLMLPVLTEADELIWDELVSITNAGLLPVSKIAAEGIGIYAASDTRRGPRLFTHNMYNKA